MGAPVVSDMFTLCVRADECCAAACAAPKLTRSIWPRLRDLPPRVRWHASCGWSGAASMATCGRTTEAGFPCPLPRRHRTARAAVTHGGAWRAPPASSRCGSAATCPIAPHSRDNSNARVALDGLPYRCRRRRQRRLHRRRHRGQPSSRPSSLSACSAPCRASAANRAAASCTAARRWRRLQRGALASETSIKGRGCPHAASCCAF